MAFNCITPDGDRFGHFDTHEAAQHEAELANAEQKFGKTNWQSSGAAESTEPSDDATESEHHGRRGRRHS